MFSNSLTEIQKDNSLSNQFKVVLFSEAHFDSLYHYSCDSLPILGQIIELEKGRTLFEITETFLLPTTEEGNKTAYILIGTILGHRLSDPNFKNLKHRMHRTANLDIEFHSYGDIVFPASLDWIRSYHKGKKRSFSVL